MHNIPSSHAQNILHRYTLFRLFIHCRQPPRVHTPRHNHPEDTMIKDVNLTDMHTLQVCTGTTQYNLFSKHLPNDGCLTGSWDDMSRLVWWIMTKDIEMRVPLCKVRYNHQSRQLPDRPCSFKVLGSSSQLGGLAPFLWKVAALQVFTFLLSTYLEVKTLLLKFCCAVRHSSSYSNKPCNKCCKKMFHIGKCTHLLLNVGIGRGTSHPSHSRHHGLPLATGWSLYTWLKLERLRVWGT